MPTSVNWNGTSYDVPDAGELNWSDLSALLVDLGTNAQTTGAQQWTTRVTAAATDTIAAADMVILMTNSGARTCNLPSATSGRLCVVIDGNGNAATNNVSVETPGAETVSGAANYVINDNYGGILLLSDGTDWFGVASFTLDSAENPMTTAGDIIVGDSNGQMTRLGVGSNEQNLVLASGTPAWGWGNVPLGAIIPFYNSGLTGTMTLPASGNMQNGYQRCDGVAANVGATVSGTLPDLTSSRFLRGSATAGGTGGAASVTLGVTNLPSHTHVMTHGHGDTIATSNTVTNHSHSTGSYAIANTVTNHSHSTGSYATGTTNTAHSHTKTVGGYTAGHSHASGPELSNTGAGPGGWASNYKLYQSASIFVSGTWQNTGNSYMAGPTANHSHTVNISGVTGNVKATTHNHSMSGSSGSLSGTAATHNHSISGSSGSLSGTAATHNHSVTGGVTDFTGGTGATGSGTSFSIVPIYTDVVYLMRVL